MTAAATESSDQGRWLVVLTLCAVGLLGIVAIFASAKIALALVPALAAGLAMLYYPFLGLMAMVALSQADAIGTLISRALPISLFKLLTVGTLGATMIWWRRTERSFGAAGSPIQLKLGLLFVIWAVLSTLLAEHSGAARGRTIDFAALLVFFLMIVVLTDTVDKLRLLVWTMIATGSFSALVVIGDTVLNTRLLSTSEAAITAEWGGRARSAGASDYNPTTASHMVMATTFLSLTLFLAERRFRTLYAAAACLGGFALMLSLSRSAVLAGAVVGAVLAYQYRSSRLFPFALLTAVAAGIAALPFVPDVVWERLGTLFGGESDRTLFRRLSYNMIGVELFADHPIIGIGPGNYPHYYVGHEFRWYPGRVPVPRQLHNTFMEVTVEMGLVGIGLFVGFLGSSLAAGIAAMRSASAAAPFAAAAVFSLAAFGLGAVFMPHEDNKFMWILPGICVAAWRLASADASIERAFRARQERLTS